MNRRTLLKSILITPFLSKLLNHQTEKEAEVKRIGVSASNSIIRNPDFKEALDKTIDWNKSNYTKLAVYCTHPTYVGQYVIFTLWHTDVKICGHTYQMKEVRPAISWDDVKQSCIDNTFAGVAINNTIHSGVIQIYASKLSLEKMKNRPICFYDASAVI